MYKYYIHTVYTQRYVGITDKHTNIQTKTDLDRQQNIRNTIQ